MEGILNLEDHADQPGAGAAQHAGPVVEPVAEVARLPEGPALASPRSPLERRGTPVDTSARDTPARAATSAMVGALAAAPAVIPSDITTPSVNTKPIVCIDL